MRLRVLPTLIVCAVCIAGARAAKVEEVMRIHLEAIGGSKRVEALSALRATGQVITGGKRLRFTMTAARPDRVRLETESGGRTLVQASDGKEPPWEFDTGTWPPRYQPMAEVNVRTFTADAEFDDPLVTGKSRGYEFEDAGETEIDGRKLLRVAATRHRKESFHLLLDPDTFLILLRVEPRAAAGGKPQLMITRFDDFRPVSGVLLPHQVTAMVDGKVVQTTKIDQIEPNPEITADTFSRPKSAAK